MLWFDGQAEEAARLYVSVFEDASIGTISQQPDGSARWSSSSHWPASASRRSTAALSTAFTPAVSFVIDCDDAGGGRPLLVQAVRGRRPGGQQCGWLEDRFGVSWQVVPRAARRVHERPRPGEGGADRAGDAAR